MSKKDLYELIEKYLNGSLDPAEMEAVRARIASDETFAREVQLHQELSETFGDQGVEAFSKKIKKVIQGDKEDRSLPVGNRYKWLKWMAILLMMIIIFWAGRKLFTGTDSGEIYRQFADFPKEQDYLDPESTRSDEEAVSEVVDSLWMLYFQQYNNRDYEVADRVLSEIEAKDPRSSQLLLQKGFLAVQNKDFDRAVSYFEMASKNQDMAIWYLGLTFLKLNKIESAIVHFEEIATKVHPRAEQAKNILQQLNNI